MSAWIDQLVGDRPAGRLVAWAGEVEFSAAAEDDRIGRTVRLRLIRRPEEMTRAHPFAPYTRRRRGHAGTRFEASFAQIDGAREFMIEVMLLGWADGPQGATAAFLLDAALETHPFMGCTRHSKEAAGTRFMLALLEKDDDEEIVDQKKRARLEHARGGRRQTLSNAATLLIKNPRFWDWLMEYAEPKQWDAASADGWLKKMLGIDSKSRLDEPLYTRAIEGYEKIRGAFVAWQEAQGFDPSRD